MNPKYAIWIGVVILALGSYMLVTTIADLSNFTATEGRVVRLIVSGSVEERKYTPVIEFEDQSGNNHAFKSKVNSQYDWPVGREVKVLFNPADPDEARVGTLYQLWFAPLGLLGMGAGIIAAIRYNSRRSQKPESSR